MKRVKRVVRWVGDGWVVVGVGAGSEGGNWNLVKQRWGACIIVWGAWVVYAGQWVDAEKSQ